MLVLSSALALLSPVAFAMPALKIPKALQAIEAKYAKAGTLSASFAETNEVVALAQTKKSSGKLAVKMPDKIRWQQTSPDTSLVISDGKKYYFYTPPFDSSDAGQLMIKKTAAVQSRLMHALLSADFKTAALQGIVQLSPSLFGLIPKKGSAGTVVKAEILTDLATQQIRKVVLFHRGGNRSQIELSNIKLGEKLPDSDFTFDPPPNTTISNE